MITESDPTAADRDRLRVEILRAEHAREWRRADAARAALKGLLVAAQPRDRQERAMMPLPPPDDRIGIAIAVGIFCVCTTASLGIAYVMGWL